MAYPSSLSKTATLGAIIICVLMMMASSTDAHPIPENADDLIDQQHNGRPSGPCNHGQICWVSKSWFKKKSNPKRYHINDSKTDETRWNLFLLSWIKYNKQINKTNI